jgi:phage-related protein (TIGR01555 family)
MLTKNIKTKKNAPEKEPEEKRASLLRRASEKAKETASIKPYSYPIQAPQLMPGVVPDGIKAPVMAQDSPTYQQQYYGYDGCGFPGFSYLSQLATRAEYRAFASSLSTELTRKWLEFTSTQDDGNENSQKLKAIEEEFKRIKVRETIRACAENDCYFGRAQIFIEIAGANRKLPLVLDGRTVKQGSLQRIVSVEPIWTTPSAYNALDPAAPDFYKPSQWYMLGQEVHASRMLTITTRPLPDILKPAFNFAGMSLSQLAEAYVDNWLRTRQSVSDLISNFSITALATAMDQILQGNDNGADLLARADLFTATRDNKGLMLIDKEREELVQVNTPLSGLHELQAQSQEHMCSVSRTPAVILTGISPSGLNASSEGEIQVFYDWVAAQQEAYWREPIETILKVVQLSLFGEIDPSIGFDFVPLYQLTEKEESDIRLQDSQVATNYINMGIVTNDEVREKLAHDPNSGFQGLDTSVEIVPPNEPTEEDDLLNNIVKEDGDDNYSHKLNDKFVDA